MLRAPMYMAAACGAGALIWSASSAAGTTTLAFGTACQETFDDASLGDLTGACDSADGFAAQMSTFASDLFSYDLTGAVGPRFLEEAYDVTSKVEAADIVYVSTHGGSNYNFGGKPSVQLAGKAATANSGSGLSQRMKLGNEGKGLSVLALQSCATTAWWPRRRGNGTSEPRYDVYGQLPARWRPAFSGGLRMVLGNWDVSHVSSGQGNLFGKYVKAGRTFSDAWRSADWETNRNTDTSVAAAGNSAADCTKKINEMTIYNMENGSFPRRTGSSASYFCYWYWSNDALSDKARYPCASGDTTIFCAK